MCGSLSGYRSWQDMRDWFDLLPSEPMKAAGITPEAVIRPTDPWPLIRRVTDQTILDSGLWGFADPKGRTTPVINARTETLDILPLFRDAFASQRCAIPVTGYYEWKRAVDGRKTPWRFSLNGAAQPGIAPASQRTSPERALLLKDGAPSLFALAGLFTFDRAAKQLRFVIVTTEANDLAAEVHDRMPVILDEGGIAEWLTPETDPGALKRLCRPYEGANLTAKVVSNTLHQRPKAVDHNQLSLGV
jgi:putative SOS response-associated peptidase YedK